MKPPILASVLIGLTATIAYCPPVDPPPPTPIVIGIRSLDDDRMLYIWNTEEMEFDELRERIVNIQDRFGNSDPVLLIPSTNISFPAIINSLNLLPLDQTPVFIVTLSNNDDLCFVAVLRDHNLNTEMMDIYRRLTNPSPQNDMRLMNAKPPNGFSILQSIREQAKQIIQK